MSCGMIAFKELGLEDQIERYVAYELVSAQNRQRIYWLGRKNEDGTYSKIEVEQPKDRGILLKDILEDSLVEKDKAYCLKHQAGNARDYFKKHHTNIKFEPVNFTDGNKSQTIKSQYYKNSIANFCCYNSTYGATGVAEPIRVGSLPRPNGELSQSQAFRIYDTNGKSVNINAGGGGAGGKTGLYAVPVEFKDNKPVKAISGSDGKTYQVYEVKRGFITIKGKEYPIKLDDGFYIIRKLTVTECMRLQTVPEWYEFPVSDTRAYQLLGNGWTIDIITFLLSHTISQ